MLMAFLSCSPKFPHPEKQAKISSMPGLSVAQLPSHQPHVPPQAPELHSAHAVLLPWSPLPRVLSAGKHRLALRALLLPLLLLLVPTAACLWRHTHLALPLINSILSSSPW